jgi:hypothetical protein
MAMEVGRLIWIPCDVKPGPFSDERMVRIHSDHGEWVAFVPVDALRDSILEGSTFVRAVIVRVNGGHFNAKVAGEPVTSSLFEGTLTRVEPIAALQA